MSHMILFLFTFFTKCDEIDEFIEGLNIFRQENNISALERDFSLDDQADYIAQKSAESSSIESDNQKLSKTLVDRIRGVNLGYAILTLNNVILEVESNTPHEILKVMRTNAKETDDSPALNPQFDKIGVGIKSVPAKNTWVWDIIFVATKHEEQEK